jgi:hypothetical protein
MRYGGLVSRFVSCFVDFSDAASLPSMMMAAMPGDMCIPQGDVCLVDEYLIEEELLFLAGAYQCYHDGMYIILQTHRQNSVDRITSGKVDLSKSAQMESWLPRGHIWNGSACDKKIWSPDAEEIWRILVEDILSGSGQPLTTKQWKNWARGLLERKCDSIGECWAKYKQVGSRAYTSKIRKAVEDSWNEQLTTHFHL